MQRLFCAWWFAINNMGVGWEEWNETQQIPNILTRLKAKSMYYFCLLYTSPSPRD